MSKQLFLNILLLSLFAVSLSADCNALRLKGTCDYYQACLEEKYHCGPNGYPVGYGFKYCSKFVAFYEYFPPKGKEWVTKTLVCLKQALHPLYLAESNCETILNAAFDSHPECYFQSGFCDLFLDRENILKTLKALLKVYEIRDFMSVTSLKQVYDTARMCGKDYISHINQLFKEIFFPHFMDGWNY
jgi:hypothetical protein